jgi:hypothetical protein
MLQLASKRYSVSPKIHAMACNFMAYGPQNALFFLVLPEDPTTSRPAGLHTSQPMVDQKGQLHCYLLTAKNVIILLGFYHSCHYDQLESQIFHLTDGNLNLAIAHLQHESVLPFYHLHRNSIISFATMADSNLSFADLNLNFASAPLQHSSVFPLHHLHC